MARETARQQRVAEAARRRQIREEQTALRVATREAARRDREMKKSQMQADKDARGQYLEARIAETEGLNSDLRDRIEKLSQVLEHTLHVDDSITFASLRINDDYPPFEPPEELQRPSDKPVQDDFLSQVIAPRGLRTLLPSVKKRHARELQKAQEEYASAAHKWEIQEKRRTEELDSLRVQHEKSRAIFQQKRDQRNAEVAELEQAYVCGDPGAVAAYTNMVLERSEYPEGFPQKFRLAYVPESKQMVIEYELPTVEIVPQVLEHRYMKAKDEITDKPRKMAEIRELYQDIVSAIALRSIHEVIEADQGNHLEVVCFNGFLQTVDPATGRDVRPHLISVRTTRKEFEGIDLSRVDKVICLRNLGAQVSPRPAEAQAVKPIIEFDMVDKRFVEQSDVLSDLESRPNLMELNPFEFEHLVANLFAKMGLETKLTRSSRDGGVDCVAFDSRPVLGGKVVIQAKRYSNTVGVSAVRDLYGTMMNEGANKGILVTTSGYGPDAFEFSKDKPIELIDGGGLLYLLEQAGTKARIIFLDE